MNVIDQLTLVCAALEQRVMDIPGLVTTEADAQAELHSAVLDAFPERIPLEADTGLLTYGHHVWPLLGCRAYREISAGSSRATTRSDIILLRNEAQVLVPKSGGAPARFGRPAACLIEVKLDIGRSTNARIASAVERDFEKWTAQIASAEADTALAVVFTDRPDVYRGLQNPRVVAIKCETMRHHSPVSDSLACEALSNAILASVEAHRRFPLTMLREKDFETRILTILRKDTRISPGNAMSQHRLVCSKSNRLRPLDIAVFGADSSRPIAVAELKTSHSASFKTLGREQLEDEAAFLDTLVTEGAQVAVVIFRYGTASVSDDQFTWRARWPKFCLTYAEC